MGFIWTTENIKWFERAADQTEFYSLVANQLRDVVTSHSTVFDLGCGTGYLSMELSPFVASVTAVDWNEEALQFLQRKSKERQIDNIMRELRDWRCWQPDSQADLVCISYCDGFMEHFPYLMELTKRFLVGIFPLEHRESHPNQETFPKLVQFLQRQQIPFESTTICCDFGQPMESLDECREFLNHYTKTPKKLLPDELLTRYLSENESGWYLPKVRKSGLLLIDKENWLKKG
ncbi:class I SAM-dependent methyltransferase [Brevibacillus sp. SYSU BS000544]|uniref:class I SAM-dependent methyltransferase n=1 Tax=Brevibacillus sp. SYSU BS000544 TaxID=3416443 RepID=UPI003CE5B434